MSYQCNAFEVKKQKQESRAELLKNIGNDLLTILFMVDLKGQSHPK